MVREIGPKNTEMPDFMDSETPDPVVRVRGIGTPATMDPANNGQGAHRSLTVDDRRPPRRLRTSVSPAPAVTTP